MVGPLLEDDVLAVIVVERVELGDGLSLLLLGRRPDGHDSVGVIRRALDARRTRPLRAAQDGVSKQLLGEREESRNAGADQDKVCFDAGKRSAYIELVREGPCAGGALLCPEDNVVYRVGKVLEGQETFECLALVDGHDGSTVTVSRATKQQKDETHQYPNPRASDRPSFFFQCICNLHRTKVGYAARYRSKTADTIDRKSVV